MDFSVANHGSIFIISPLTDSAKDWIAENVSDESQWFGGGLVVEHRYVDTLVEGMENDGLVRT
jgi:hypothetical protein